ncbi:MAG TPA: threonine/serine exporter family protein [Candidatus Limnocylindrales bacterium]|nr:threonine/serine exporter family protein [Candidatus Limnocylindrales bacterium]
MTQPAPPVTDTTSAAATAAIDPLRVRRILEVARRVGMLLLASGAQTSEVEDSIRNLASDLGLAGVQAGVLYSSIQLSYVEPGDLRPTTIVQMASDRASDFRRLSDVASVLRRVASGRLDLDGAEAEVARIERDVRRGPLLLALLAPAISSSALAILFGGSVVDALATFVIALLVQPFVAWLRRTGLPPFFSLLLGALAATLLVAVAAWSGVSVEPGLLMTASLIQFLPGGALLAGVRDLIDQSMVSGTARLSEALLIGAGVASGALLGINLAANVGVSLTIESAGQRSWDPIVALLAVAVAVVAYGYQISVPPFALPWVGLLGAAAWTVYALLGYSPEVGTFTAAFLVGVAGRMLARQFKAPAALWVVPAILPLLPGLALVVALLAEGDLQRFGGIWNAILIAFGLGVGVAAGDIAVAAVDRVRRGVVVPAMDAVTTGIGALVLQPGGRTTDGAADDAARRPGRPRRGRARVSAPRPVAAEAPASRATRAADGPEPADAPEPAEAPGPAPPTG